MSKEETNAVLREVFLSEADLGGMMAPYAYTDLFAVRVLLL